MAWYDDLNNGLSLSGSAMPGSIDALRAMKQQTAPQQKKEKNFWTDQISTGGGIGGALGGAALGTAILPGIGTLIGGALGGALGSGVGEATENVITGDDLLKNVGQEALLGGVFSAPPIRGAKAIIGGGKALLSRAGKTAANEAVQTALTQPGAIARALGKAGEATANVSTDLAVRNFRFTPTQLKNFKQKFGEDAGKTIKKYGFNTAEDITEKGINPLRQQFSTLTQNIGQVSKQDLQKTFESKIAKLANSASTDQQALAKQLRAEADSILKQFGNSETIDARALNGIKSQFDGLVNYTERLSNPSRYGVNKRAADAIRETLQKADPTGTLKGVGQEIQKLTQLADNAAKQAELGRGSLPLGMTNLLGGTLGASAVGNPLGAVAGLGAAKFANSATGRRATMNSADALSEALLNAGNRTVNPYSFGGTTARMVGANTTSGILNAGQDLSSPGNMMDTNTTTATTTNPIMSSNIGQSYNTTQQSANPYPQENLIYDIQRDPANADKYIAYYQSLQEVFTPATPKLNATQIQQANNANSALADVQAVAQAIQQDPGVLIRDAVPGGSIARRLTGTTDYDAAKQNIVDVIARLRSGAAITQDEANRYMSLLPTIGDTQESAMNKLYRLSSLLSGFANPQAVGTNDLESALLQAQGAQ